MTSTKELVLQIEQIMLMQDKAIRLENAIVLIEAHDAEVRAEGKTVPMEMLEEISCHTFGSAMPTDSRQAVWREIANRHGYTVTESGKEEGR